MNTSATLLETPTDASATAQRAPRPHRTVIEAEARPGALRLGELWQQRELLYFLAWRDVKVRYKQTLLGAAWAVIQPLLMMVVFTIFLGRLAGISSGSVPYPLFVYAGLLPWTFFATSIAGAAQSVVGSEQLITKVYFPRLAIPFAAVAAALVDFAIACGLLAGMMVWYGVVPGAGLAAAPLAVACLALAALGMGTLLAALNVAYRDFRYVVPFLVQLWMFATPTIYLDPATLADHGPPAVAGESSTAPAAGPQAAVDSAAQAAPPAALGKLGLRALVYGNPLTGLVAFFRAAALGSPLPWGMLAVSAVVSAAMFACGCWYFRRMEGTFADVI